MHDRQNYINQELKIILAPHLSVSLSQDCCFVCCSVIVCALIIYTVESPQLIHKSPWNRVCHNHLIPLWMTSPEEKARKHLHGKGVEAGGFASQPWQSNSWDPTTCAAKPLWRGGHDHPNHWGNVVPLLGLPWMQEDATTREQAGTQFGPASSKI